MFEQLSSGLLLAVIRAAALPLDHLLAILPPHMHAATIEAAFPTFIQFRALILDCDHMSVANAAVVLQIAVAKSKQGPPQLLTVKNVLVNNYHLTGAENNHNSF